MSEAPDLSGLEHVGFFRQPVVPKRQVLELPTAAQATIECLVEIFLIQRVASLANGHGVVCDVNAIDSLLLGKVLDLVSPIVVVSRHPDAEI